MSPFTLDRKKVLGALILHPLLCLKSGTPTCRACGVEEFALELRRNRVPLHDDSRAEAANNFDWSRIYRGYCAQHSDVFLMC
jgi:hypothetical protein